MLEQMNQLRTIQLKPEVKSLDELINSYQNPEGTDPLPKIDLEKLLIKEFLNFNKTCNLTLSATNNAGSNFIPNNASIRINNAKLISQNYSSSL